MREDVGVVVEGVVPKAPAVAADPDADHLVLAAIARGDHRGALAVLMASHGATVYGRCLRIVGDASTAQDVLQQTFLEAYCDLATFAGRSSLRGWLLGISTHRALDAVRSRRRREKRFRLDADLERVNVVADVDPIAGLDRDVRRRAIEDCLSGVSEEARVALLLRFEDGMSYEEMGRALGEKAGTLQARVIRALPALRRCLERKGVTR